MIIAKLLKGKHERKRWKYHVELADTQELQWVTQPYCLTIYDVITYRTLSADNASHKVLINTRNLTAIKATRLLIKAPRILCTYSSAREITIRAGSYISCNGFSGFNDVIKLYGSFYNVTQCIAGASSEMKAQTASSFATFQINEDCVMHYRDTQNP